MAADILLADKKMSSLSPGYMGNLISKLASKEDDDHSEDDDPLASMKKACNLISIVSDITKTDEKPKALNLTQIAKEIRQDGDSEVAAFSLTKIASEIREHGDSTPKSGNLTQIAQEIRQDDDIKMPTNLIGITSDIFRTAQNLDKLKDEQSDDSDSFEDLATGMRAAIDVLGLVQASNLINIASEIRVEDTLPSQNLTNIASIIMNKPTNSATNSTSNLVDIAGEIRKDEKPTNLINIAGIIMNKSNKTPVDEIASYIKYRNTIRDLIKKKGLSDVDKLNVISTLTMALVESRIDPQFPISWLLLYSNALINLNAEQDVKTVFNRWLWNSIGDLKNNPHEQLTKIAPEVLIQLASDDNSNFENQKLIDFIDRYMVDLDRDNKLDVDTFYKLINATPKESRESFDQPTIILISLLKKDLKNVDLPTRKKLFNTIDFNKLNESTLENCKNCVDIVPAEYVTQAALNLCGKLRKELVEANIKLKAFNITSPQARPVRRDSSYCSSFRNNYQVPKYTAPPSARNRSSDLGLSDRSAAPLTPKPIIVKKSTYVPPPSSSSCAAAAASTIYYSNAYSLVPPPRLTPYHSRPNSVLASTYKSNFNPATTTNNLYNHVHSSRVHHHHHHPSCHDYATVVDSVCLTSSSDLDCSLKSPGSKKATSPTFNRFNLEKDNRDIYSGSYTYSKIY